MFTAIAALCMIIASEPENRDLEDMVQHLKDRGCRRVAVFPEVVQRDPQGCLQLAFDGPASRDLARRLRSELLTRADGCYTVAEEEEIRNAVLEYSPPDLDHQEVWDKIIRQLNVEAILLARAASKELNELDLKLELMRCDAPAWQATTVFPMSVSDLAFAGTSFELRCWRGDRLELVGFPPETNRPCMLGLGREFEKLQARTLRGGLPHPFDIPDFPILIQYRVNKQNRKPERIGQQYYLRLEEGDRFSVILHNQTQRSVLAGLYVDGANAMGRRFEHPDETPHTGLRFFPPGERLAFDGWCRPDSNATRARDAKEVEVEETGFVATRRPIPDAGQRPVGDKLGMITLLIYTNGLEDIEDAPRAPLVTRSSAIWIGEGEPESVALRVLPGKKGLLLAAITVHYLTDAELQRIRNAP